MFASTFEICFLSIVFIFCSIFSTYLAHFIYVFFRVFSFVIFWIDSLATCETIIAVLFCFFSGFYCFLSQIYILRVKWIALLSWFYLVLVLVLQEPQEGETRGVSVWGY
jgi:hypothetical protein